MQKITRLAKNIYLIIFLLLFSTCSPYFWQTPIAWALKSSLQSVSESESHGLLVINRNSTAIYVLVDEHAVFKGSNFKYGQAEFLLSPGKHILKVRYHWGNLNTDVLQKTIDIEINKKLIVNIQKNKMFNNVDVSIMTESL